MPLDAQIDQWPEQYDRFGCRIEDNFILRESILPIYPDGMEPCGKFWYRSREDAEQRMSTMKPDPNRGPNWILNVYACYGCDGFHIGHTTQKRLDKLVALIAEGLQ